MSDEAEKQAVLERLSRASVGLSAREVARSCRMPLAQASRHLRSLHGDGLVQRSGSRWKANSRSPSVPPRLAAGAQLAARGTRNGAASSTRSAGSSIGGEREFDLRGPNRQTQPSSRWHQLRRLCEYYAECIRLDQGTTIHAKAREEYQKIVCLERLGIDTANPEGWSCHRVPREWHEFIRTLVQEPFAFLGFPLHRFHWRDRSSDAEATYISPVFLTPVEAKIDGEVLCLRPKGSLRVNEGWLERRFQDPDERRAFVELCGPSLLSDDPRDSGFKRSPRELLNLLEHYYPELCRETLSSASVKTVLPLSNLERDGIYNRIGLILPRRSPYTKRLHNELLEIAWQKSDAEIERSALRYVFPDAMPSPPTSARHEEQHEWKVLSRASALPLNTEQQLAAYAAATEPLAVIVGPPGTGKSQTVTAILSQAALANRSALFASRNHQALEAVVPRLNSIVEPRSLAIRLSFPFGNGIDNSLARLVEDIFSRPSEVNRGQERAGQRHQLLIDCCQQLAAVDHSVSEVHRLRLDLMEQEAAFEYTLESLNSDQLKDALRSLTAAPRKLASDQVLQRLTSALEPAGPPGFSVRWCLRSLKRWAFRKRAIATARAIDAEFQEAFFGISRRPSPEGAGRDAADFFYQVLRFWLPIAKAASAANRVAGIRSDLAGLARLEDLYQRRSSLETRSRQLVEKTLQDRAVGAGVELADHERTQLAEYLAAIRNRSALDLESDRRRLERYQRECQVILRKFVQVIATTNLSVGRDLALEGGSVDLLVLDEASQCDIASVVPLLFRCRRAVIVGDPMQLPHVTSLSAATDRQLRTQLGVAADNLERFSYRSTSAFDLVNSSAGSVGRVSLRQHHRCHPAIAGYCNEQFYGENLEILTEDDGTGLQWTDVRADARGVQGGGAVSDGQIDAVIREIQSLQARRFDGTIGVVTPFRAQANRLRDNIWENFEQTQLAAWRMLVNTADGFQGDERDVILLSLVGGPTLPAGSANFLAAAPNRFNVAVSRARKLLHVFADRQWASACGIRHIESLADACKKAERAADASRNAPFREDLVGPVWEPMLAEALRAAGVPFQQQYPACGRYLDFAIFGHRLKLNVEVDGESYHRGADGNRLASDQRRDLALVAAGWQVMRFWVYELREDMAGCVGRIVDIWRSSAK